jgi:hypothetical protein
MDSSSPEGRVKFEGASQGYEFSSEESEGEENNREVRDDPLESSSSEGRVKSEGARRTRTPDSHLQILPVPPEGPPLPYLPVGDYPADSPPPYFLHQGRPSGV